MTLAEATEAYQASLEHVRAAREHAPALVADLTADLHRARAHMERAWLEQTPTLPEDA